MVIALLTANTANAAAQTQAWILAQPLNLPAPLTSEDFIEFDPKQAEIGRLLFFDKILSGNRNISCATCHHPRFGTSDGLSLGVGEGGVGLGPERTSGTGASRIEKRVPRNAPALWNLAAKDLQILMHDGRISISDDYGNGFNTPAEEWLPAGLNSLLAVQALFPLTSATEMAGGSEENEVAGAVNDRIDKGWPILAKRVRTLPEYGQAFVTAFDHIDRAEQVTITEIANALAAFIGTEFRSHNSAFDRYAHGDASAISPAQERGMHLFYGKAGCANCHNGPLFTDQQFHALGLPAFGPGRTRRFDPMVRDVGRMGESDQLEDAYRFRTPSLRNIALSAPYGHNGAYPTLRQMVRHHLNPAQSRANWHSDDAALVPAPWLEAIDFVVQSDRLEMARQAAATDIALPPLTEADVEDIIAFLNSLTDPTAQSPFAIPEEVPSGLPVDR